MTPPTQVSIASKWTAVARTRVYAVPGSAPAWPSNAVPTAAVPAPSAKAGRRTLERVDTVAARSSTRPASRSPHRPAYPEPDRSPHDSPPTTTWSAIRATDTTTAVPAPSRPAVRTRRRPAVPGGASRPTSAEPSARASPIRTSQRSPDSEPRGAGSLKPAGATCVPTPKTKNPEVRWRSSLERVDHRTR